MSTDPAAIDAGWLEPALALSRDAGWNQTEDDWSVFFRHGTVFGVTAGEQLVATAAVLPYGAGFGWISMVLVAPGWRSGGLATRLMAACIALLQAGGRAALLDATPAGSAVYARLGFVPLGAIERWEGLGGAAAVHSGQVDAALDRTAFGADRGFLLADFLARPGSVAIGMAGGFAVLRRGAAAMQIGPIVGAAAAGPTLAAAAIEAATGRVVVDVLDTGLIPTLRARGFRPQRSFSRMARGCAMLPGSDPTLLLAAAGPEFG